MEQARRSALAHHVHRTAPMGPRVLINGIWYYIVCVQLALLNSAMTARFLRAAARRLEPRLRGSSIGFVLAILLAIRKIDLYLYFCVRFDTATLLSKVFGSRVAFVRQQFARICRSARASGGTSGRREPNLSLRRMQLPLRESPPRNGARRLPWCPEQARTRWYPGAAHARRAHSK